MPIIYSKSAIKFLQKQNAAVQQRILGAINQIPAGNINIIDIDNRGQVYK
ncbi:MAG: hypothetical protein FWG68_00345 [Defluviitaleaceae bacterium]|nr:hypothetical protein [Defluviitaleaceae bacterium]